MRRILAFLDPRHHLPPDRTGGILGIDQIEKMRRDRHRQLLPREQNPGTLLAAQSNLPFECLERVDAVFELPAPIVPIRFRRPRPETWCVGNEAPVHCGVCVRHGNRRKATGIAKGVNAGLHPATALPRRQQTIQPVEHDLRPGLEFVPPREEFIPPGETQLRDCRLAGRHIGGLQFHKVHHPEVHTADLGRVVIDQRHRPLGETAAEPQLLGNLTPHRIVVGGTVEVLGIFIGVVHMTADADRGFGHEPLLAGFRPAPVVQDFPAVKKHRIRDDLLEGGIVLGRGPRHEEIVLTPQERGQIIVHPLAEPLKTSQRIEKFAPHHQYLFF